MTFYDALSKEHSRIDKFNPSADVKVATYTISRLHLLYQNTPGLLPSDETIECSPLTEIEILEICAWSWKDSGEADQVELEQFYHAFHWMNVFIERVKRFLPYSSPRYLIEYILKQANTYGRPKYLRKALTVETFDLLLKDGRDEEAKMVLQKISDDFERDRETQVCRRSGDRSQEGNYCFLFHSPRSPYAPFRYEILHRDPYVAVVHNFMPPKMADKFVSEASAEDSKVSKVVSVSEGSKVAEISPKVRLSESIVLPYNHTSSTWLDLRVEHATFFLPHSQPMRFGIRDAERSQVVHYGLSGHFRAHVDLFSDEYLNNIPGSNSGNRLATVLVYLSDVRSGGETAFTILDVSLTPRSGSALVWFNLDPWSGKGLPDTEHVACPVNVGKKWIINKWIRTHHKIRHALPVVY